MEVVRDSEWCQFFVGIKKNGHEDEYAFKMADSMWRFRVRAKAAQVAIDDRKPKLINPQQFKGEVLKTTCKAILMSGKPCSAKSSCGAYCKRHQI